MTPSPPRSSCSGKSRTGSPAARRTMQSGPCRATNRKTAKWHGSRSSCPVSPGWSRTCPLHRAPRRGSCSGRAQAPVPGCPSGRGVGDELAFAPSASPVPPSRTAPVRAASSPGRAHLFPATGIAALRIPWAFASRPDGSGPDPKLPGRYRCSFPAVPCVWPMPRGSPTTRGERGTSSGAHPRG